MRSKATCILFLLIPLCAWPQEKSKRNFVSAGGGNFSLGVRTTVSTFGHGSWKETGYGAGGHFRLQLTDRINTEWFLDVIHTDIAGMANRKDYHIGWSVMYYLISPKEFKRPVVPYVVAGHCFDHTRIAQNGRNESAQKRGSSAVQAGLGTHFNITPKFDISLTCQYMLHLGKELHAHIEGDELHIEKHANAGWEGHLLISLSANYKFMKLWKPKG
jgi:hypothetical protein